MCESSDRKTSSFLTNSIIKNANSTLHRQQNETVEPKPCQFLLDMVDNLQTYLPVDDFVGVNPNYTIEDAVRYLRVQGGTKMHKFPISTILPKVQMSNKIVHRELPRPLKVQRCFRQYSSTHITQELTALGIKEEDLHPTEEQYSMLSENAAEHFLPLSYFDNVDFAEHSPAKWLSLGKTSDGETFPIPAKAYIPIESSLFKHSWQMVAVHNYDSVTGLWKVTRLSDDQEHYIPKVQFHFLAENPQLFAKRIEAAVKLRNDAEHLLHLESVIDNVIMHGNMGTRAYHQKCTKKLYEKMKCNNDRYEWLHNEVKYLSQRLMACYELKELIKAMPREFPLFDVKSLELMLPKPFKTAHIKHERKSLRALKLNIKNKTHNLLMETLYYNRGGVEALQTIAAECQQIETMSLFIVPFLKPIPLQDFLMAQKQNGSNVANFLTTFWPERISSRIALVLRPLGKGWLDIMVSKWPVYKLSKIFKLMAQTKIRMEQSCQNLLRTSIDRFVHNLTDPCLQFLHVTEKFEWTKGYIESEFPFEKPIFYLILGVSEKDRRVFYSTPPEQFEPLLREVFKTSLDKCGAVRCIDAETIINLNFDPRLYIKTVELIEDFYIECDKFVCQCYKAAMIPLRAYMKLYECFIPFCCINIPEYMVKYAAAKKSSWQVRQDIEEHQRIKKELRETLPANITIGPFLVNVDNLKNSMIKKHSEIVKLIFEYYVERLFEQNDELLDTGTRIFNKISDRPLTIEHLIEIREYAQFVPDEVDQLRQDVHILMLEYDLLDNFFYNVSDQQFGMKWRAIGWPHKILQRLATLRDEQKSDIDEFKRQHSSNLTVFEERLESLNDEIQQFSLNFDAGKVIEMAVEVKLIWKQILELQKTGDMLASRQKLFELPDLSLQFLDNIINSFLPYRNMWLAGADIIKLQELTTGNPMVSLDLHDVGRSIEDLRANLLDSYRVFSEKPEVQEVVMEFLDNLNNFVPIYNCIKWIRTDDWLLVHWQELASRSGMEIKYSININFQYLIKKGILNYLQLVEQISTRAHLEHDDLLRAEEEERLRKEAELLEFTLSREKRKCRRDIL